VVRGAAAKANLSRTLKTMEGYGLVRLERGDKGRITPKVTRDRAELDLPLIGSRDTDQSPKVG
jgi:predicted transcriptional regulator